MFAPSMLDRYLAGSRALEPAHPMLAGRRRGRRRRRDRTEESAATVDGTTPIVLRRAVTADAVSLARLQQLDGRTLPKGERVLAQVDGRVVAAADVATGTAVADPFTPTADVVALLAFHARQLRPQTLA